MSYNCLPTHHTPLAATLKAAGCSVQDVVFVHLLLADMSTFASVNARYVEVIGSTHPPSRYVCHCLQSYLPTAARFLLTVACHMQSMRRGSS